MGTSSLAGVYRQTATCISSRRSFLFSFQVTLSISAQHNSAPRCLNREITDFLNWRYQNSVIVRANTHDLHPPPLCQIINPFTHTCRNQCCNFYINKIQRGATVGRCLFTAKLLYVFRVSIAPIIRSTSNCNCSFWYRS